MHFAPFRNAHPATEQKRTKSSSRHEAVDKTHGQGVARAAVSGVSPANLPKEAIAYLLAQMGADRIGVWIESPEDALSRARDRVVFRGIVTDRDGGHTPTEWGRLSAEAPLPADLLAHGKNVEMHTGAAPFQPLLGPLVGIHHGSWVPVHSGGCLRGVLFAGYRKKHGATPIDPLQQVAAELALSLELADQHRLAQMRLESMVALRQSLFALTNSESTSSGLASLVNTCIQPSAQGGFGAIFTVLRAWDNGVPEPAEAPWAGPLHENASSRSHMGTPPGNDSGIWRSGDGGHVRTLDSETLAGAWQRACEAHCAVTTDLVAADRARGDGVRLTVVPLEACGEALGALAIGFPQGAASATVQERLELLAAVAAAALHLRKRERRASQQAAQQQLLLDVGSAATLLVDPNGSIVGASRGAQELLRETLNASRGLASGLTESLQLTELFRARDQLEIAEWLRRAWRTHTSGESVGDFPEAELRSGIRVRLRYLIPPAASLAAVAIEPFASQDTARAERAEAQLIHVIEWLEEGVVLFDAKHDIRAMNTRFAQIAGLEPEETTQVTTLNGLIARLSPQAAQPEQFAERWREQARGSDVGVREEIQFLRPVPRMLERAARPIVDASGQRLGRVEIYRDLTAQRVFQSKLLQTEKLAALGQMVTGIAHELSNPLTSILGYAQRLLLGGDAASRSDEIRQIYQEAERASTIVRQLLMSARESRPERRRVDLNQVVVRTLDLQRFGMAAEQVRIEQDLDPTLPAIQGDAGQLQQVLMNLIGNARQAIEQCGKGGAIRVSTKGLGESRALLEVSDDGPGIPKAILARVFDPFFTTKPAGIGTGLGLTIVLGIMREHGGHVHVSTPPRGGATFTLEFPAARAEQARPSPLPATGPGTDGPGTDKPSPETRFTRVRKPSRVHAAPVPGLVAGRRVMVVEDEPTVARLIADVLQDQGLQVEVLLDGREALRHAAQHVYDLVICDMKMPGLDGQNFYNRLAATENPLHRKFLFVTGDVIAAQTQDFLERHRLPHVAKPFRVEELTEKVRQVLADTSPNSAPPAPEEKTNAARK